MSARAIWLHLRVPFSFFLLPIFWFALSQSSHIDLWRAVAVLIIIHLLLYPASNAYNSYFDKDEGPIGGLETPPPVTKTLYWVSWLLDVVALILGAFLGWPFVVYLLVYGFVTKAYSHRHIRLKKYPILSFFLISGLQGGITYVMTYVAVNDLPFSAITQPRLLFGGLLGTLNLMALYPVTQVYQHVEDARRGDRTLSLLLGVRGTFVCAIVMFTLSLVAFFVYFNNLIYFGLYVLLLLPAVAYFLHWGWQIWYDSQRANYRSTMHMMWISGVCLNSFFIFLIVLTHS
ncbi:UbiA family prenyltransferase [Spirosoma montaniterrae]|uniref:Ubiquinone biosynthesis protein UbiA n=1 Tax=Spirosoma montaniterrae TaxID=1178516 RepID=A0A1P9X323_9BACT|nr:UbiA family prenyltransferase [Spirosoma montaniterrae]AQG82034.1 ubiquinone biosynthesis protein UbiA [Spirosoma montaniterrae]